MSVHAVVLIQCDVDGIAGAAEAIALAKVIPGGIARIEGVERTESLIAFQVYSKHDLERMFSIGFDET